MTRPGLAQPPGGATRHRSSPARLALAVGLLALGIGDLAVIHRVLLPRYFAGAGATGMPVAPAAEPPVAPFATPPPPTFPSQDPGTASPPPVAVPPPAAPAALAVPLPETAPAPAPPAPAQAPKVAPASPAAAGEFPDLLFALNATWLSPASREILDKVVAVLKADTGRRVILSGHTDAAGPPDLNRTLARDRARRAGRYLQNHGIDRGRVEIQSFGSARPATETGPGTMRARNRRVEIAIE